MSAPHRAVSPHFAGRTVELSHLHDVFAQVVQNGECRLVWIRGEAGVGKTRLTREFLARIDGRATCLVGVSVAQTESGLPYAPFTGILRQLIRERGFETVSKQLGFSYTNALAWLLPEFGDAPAGDPELVRARMFDAVRKVIELLCAVGPVVLVLEDLHWSDAGSRDLLRFFVNNCAGGPVMIVATYRPLSSEGSMMRAVVADLSRLERTRTLVLQRLTRREVSDQLEGLLGYLPSGRLVSDVFRRGAGIPLFTEAMIDPNGGLKPHLPESVRDLLGSTLDDLPEETLRLLRALSAGGLCVSPRVLASVLGVLPDRLGPMARPAIDAHVLTIEDGALAFRHALLRDAVSEGLLASDAALLHAAYADTLTADPALSPATWVSMALAQHWRSAGNAEKAIVAAWRAATEANTRYAYDEQLQMLELVLDLWNEVHAADQLLATTHLDVLERATDAACWAAEPTRGLTYVSLALSEVDDRALVQRDYIGTCFGTLQVVALLLQRAMLRQQQLVPGEFDDLLRAADLASDADAMRAEVLGQLCRALIAQDQPDLARPWAKEMAGLATVLGHREFEIEADMINAHLDALAGIDSVATLSGLIDAARAEDLGRLETIGYAALMHALTTAGRHAHCVELGRLAVERATAVGQARYFGPRLAHLLANSLTLLGQWDEAAEFLDSALDVSPAPLGRAQLLLCSASLAIARGQETAAKHLLWEVRSLDRSGQDRGDRAWMQLSLEIEYALLAGEPSTALAAAASIPALAGNEASAQMLPLLCAAAKACGHDETHDALRGELLQIASRISDAGDVDAFRRLLAAECHPGRNEESRALWRDAAERFDSLGYPYHAAYGWYRFALAVADGGRRSEAKDALQNAARHVQALGAEPLCKSIADLARRARVKLVDAADSGVDTALALTDREIQVLKLLAAGKRNREIATELFISPKTASVHVSNILAKLNVKTRGAAAAIAHRLDLATG